MMTSSTLPTLSPYDGAAQKMDSVMIDRIMVKIDSLESKIEGIKNNYS